MADLQKFKVSDYTRSRGAFVDRFAPQMEANPLFSSNYIQ